VVASGGSPDYSVLMVATATGLVVDSLPYSNFTFTDTLAWSAPGSAQLTMQLLGKDRLGPSVLPALRSIRQVGQGYSLAIVRDGRCLFAGPCTAMNWDAGQAQIGCSSLGKVFDGRLVMPDGYYLSPLTAPGLSYAISPPDLVAALLTQGTTGIGRGLPLTIPPLSGAGGVPISYLPADLGTVYDRVNEQVVAVGGPDVFFTPVLSPDQSTLTWVANIGRPLLGSPRPSSTFDFNVAVDTIAGSDDYTQLATVGIVPGTVQTTNFRLMGTAGITPSGARLAFERVDRTSVSNANQAHLQSLATTFVSTYSQPVQQWTINVFPDDHPYYLSEWSIGDVVKMSIQDHPLLADGDYLRRVVGVNGHTPTTVGIVTTDVPPAMTALATI